VRARLFDLGDWTHRAARERADDTLHRVLIVVRPRKGGVGTHDAIAERLPRSAQQAAAGRAPDPECVPIEIVQQESDLTRDAGPGCSREVYRPE